MEVFAGLASLLALSLFFSRLFTKSASLMPLVAVSACIMWFTIWGVFGLLWVGGWAWYVLCFAGLVWVLVKEKRLVFQRFTPGFIFFALAGTVFILLFWLTQPLLTQWDEFTFWGTASKVVSLSNQLYTTARSGLIARAYPPGLVVFQYMMQFFAKGFSEYQMIASFAIIYLAAFSAASALWKKNRAGAAIMLATLLLFPFLFETGKAGEMSFSYLACMADLPMAALFGGGLSMYFAGGKKDQRLLMPLFLVFAALVNIKDMGFALALIALFVIWLDLVFCERGKVSFFKLRRWKALVLYAGMGFAAIAGSYLIWFLHLELAAGINRYELGSNGQSLSQITMLLTGFKALFRITPDPVFDDRAIKMFAAFFGPSVQNYILGAGHPVQSRVWIFGSGMSLLLLILLISGAAWVFSPTRRQRRRVVVFTIAMSFGFAAFYLFHTFLYSYILKGWESLSLKDYHRYIFPFWFAWLMGALVLLSGAANNKKSAELRRHGARVLAIGLSVAIAFSVVLRSNPDANFLKVSPSIYGQRQDVKAVVNTAKGEGMHSEDVVYIISQGDDATRFYIFGFEMDAVRIPLFGVKKDAQGNPAFEDGKPVLQGQAAADLVAPGAVTGYAYAVECTRQDLLRYLKENQCTHILIDRADGYIKEAFGSLFTDGLKGWDFDDGGSVGRRYYRIVWENGICSFTPELEVEL